MDSARCRRCAGGKGPFSLRAGLAAGWVVFGESGLLGQRRAAAISLLTMGGLDPPIQLVAAKLDGRLKAGHGEIN